MKHRIAVSFVLFVSLFVLIACARLITPAGAKTVWLPIKTCT